MKCNLTIARLFTQASCACLMLAGIARADESSARSCTGIADNGARLACYDTAFGVNAGSHAAASSASPGAPPAAPAATPRTPAPPAATGAAAAPAAAPAPAPEASFGDTGNLRGSPPKPVLPKRLTATVQNAVSLGQGLYRLTLDNAQIWQTTQADWALDFHPGTSVTISRMTFGNYLISLTGQGRTVSIKRIQ
jgi:hypothetical protein